MSLEDKFLLHDIKNKLHIINLSVDMLKEALLSKNIEEALDYAERLQRNASNVNEMIVETISAPKPVFIIPLLDGLIADLKKTFLTTRFNVGCTTIDPMVLGRSREISRVFENIMSNGLEELNKWVGLSKLLDIRVGIDSQFVLVSIQNNGAMIPLKVGSLDYIFNMGESGNGSTGIGLFYVKKTISEMGGTVEVRNTDPQSGFGVEFFLKLPRADAF